MDEKRDLIIPSLEELRNIYKRKMREEIRRENYRKIMYAEDEGLFFNRFRKVEDFSQKNVEVSDEAYDIYEIYRVREEKYASQRIEEFENKIAFEKFFLKWEREADRKRNLNSRFSMNAATRARVDRIMDLEGKLNHFVSNSEAAYDVYYGNKLLEDIENQRYGRLINTGYVSDAREKIIKSLENGEAVNITGHLGSGKTAIAVEAAIEFTVERRIQEYLEDELEKWYLKNREADYEDALEEFSVLNRGIRKHYRDIVNESSGESWKSLRPLFISGSHNLTYEDMFVEKTLKLESSFEKQSFGKYLDILTDNFYEWINDHKKELDIMTDKEAMNIKIEIWKSLSDILVAKNSSFGTEIKKVEKEILTAIRQGRVVIVDELNAIAMQNLIGLNDILQKKIGEYAYITGVGSVRIKPGFGFIGTGNLSTQSINYEGTNDLNPAFKSRFVNIEYNYLPQSIRGDVYS